MTLEANGNANATKGTLKQRKRITFRESTCWHCKKPIVGTKRKHFCDVSCRCQYHRDLSNKTDGEIESAQLRAYAAVLILGESAKQGSMTAIKALREIDKMLTNISKELE